MYNRLRITRNLIRSLKRSLSFFLVVSILSSVQFVYGATLDSNYNPYFAEKASLLKELGLFKGTDLGFELERRATRVEAAVIMVRLLGAEGDAIANQYQHPFLDVPEWANPYVGYLYKLGLTKGIDDHRYGSNNLISAQSFMTFCLRSLAYDDVKGDFVWTNAIQEAASIGLIDSSMVLMIESEVPIRRDLIVGILINMLNQPRKDLAPTLIEKLIESDRVDLQFALEQDLYIHPLTMTVSGKITEIRDEFIYVTFDDRNGVDFLAQVPFGSKETPYITSLSIRSDDGNDYLVYITKEVYLQQIKTKSLKINDFVQIEGKLVILVPRINSGQVVIQAEMIQ